MPPARVSLAVTMVFVAVGSACADSTASDGADIDPPLPEDDAELRCPASSPEIPVESFGPIVGAVRLGPCGHVAYHDDQEQGWLIAPDATRAKFDHSGWQLGFAPTGDLIAWAPPDGGLRLRDLLSGRERELIASDSVDRFGFVPSFADPDRSAWSWTCEQGLLERHDVQSAKLVAESVVCTSVVGSSGSPRLAYADLDGRVWRADLDGNVQTGSDDLEFAGHDGSKRDDVLWIDHDGELLVHVAVEWQGDDDIDSEWPVELWTRVLDRRGETVREAPNGLTWRQATRRGAPVFMVDDGELERFDAGAPSSVASGLSMTELADSGELLFATATNELGIAERSLDAPLTSIGQLDDPVEIQASRSGTVVAIEHLSDICIVDDQGECDRILLALRRWTRTSGFDDHVLYSTSPWELLATLDDGRMLVIGAPVEVDGPTYTGEQPSPRLLLLSEHGEIEAELPAAHGSLAVRQVFVIAADRVIFEYQDETNGGSLTVAGGQSGFISLVDVDVDVALLQAWVDARGQRYAYVSEGNGETLIYGSPPLP